MLLVVTLVVVARRWTAIYRTVEPLNKGHVGDNINMHTRKIRWGIKLGGLGVNHHIKICQYFSACMYVW